jgi:5'-methylthioadenosine phosphorylase
VDLARRTIARVAGSLPERTCECGSALANAIITDRSLIPAELKRDLAPLIGKYVGGAS